MANIFLDRNLNSFLQKNTLTKEEFEELQEKMEHDSDAGDADSRETAPVKK